MSNMPKVTQPVSIGPFHIGGKSPLVLIAGPCVIESEKIVREIAEKLKRITVDLRVPFIFKASYDKANRSSIKSFRGPGLREGLKILQKLKTDLDIPILSDVHNEEEVLPSSERGVTFGYNNLVVDMRSLVLMRDYGYPVVFDSTHSLQQPGGKGTMSGGQREMIPDLARGAVAVGCDALFMETHPDPDQALSDGPNMLKLDLLPVLLDQLVTLDQIVRGKEQTIVP